MMKQLLWLMLLAMPFYLSAQNNSRESGIQWTEGITWDQVKEKAKKENKFIFIDAYATWCVPCKKMDKEVYPDVNVGNVVNPNFISVRLQMDQTKNDNEQVKNWYPVAKKLNEDYSIGGFPSFLFFNSEGKLVHKALGYRDALGFIELTKDALTDPEARYKKSVEKFKSGQLDFASMRDAAKEAKIRKDKKIAFEMAKDFKERYLDKLSDEEAFQKENLSFMLDFYWDFMKSNERYFKLLYKQPDLADSILNKKTSRWYVFQIIRKEEIIDKIYVDSKPIASDKLNWKNYQQSITTKYGKKYLDKLFPDEQINFYQYSGEWKSYIKYVNAKIKKFPPQVNGKLFGPMYGDAWTINSYAWNLFLGCDDKELLAKGLPWVDKAISLDTSTYNVNYFDTKANLLYRMGRTKEAIELEEAAMIRSKSQDDIVENLRKMKAGLSTWPKPEATN